MKSLEEEYLVYEGDSFEVEFYYSKEGRIEIWKDFISLDEKEKMSLLARIEKIANSPNGTHHPKTIFNLEDAKNKIWAIKFGNNRFCSFFFEGGRIIITNAYKKQSQGNRSKESNQIKKASKLKSDYVKRVQEGTYYCLRR